MENCKFLNNYGENEAAAISMNYWDVEWTNCLFDRQTTDGYDGNVYSYSEVWSCIIQQ